MSSHGFEQTSVIYSSKASDLSAHAVQIHNTPGASEIYRTLRLLTYYGAQSVQQMALPKIASLFDFHPLFAIILLARAAQNGYGR